MKFNKLFIVAAVCGSSLLASCDLKQGPELQRKDAKTSLADGEAFRLIQLVGENVQSEVAYAKYAESVSTSADVKKVAEEIQKVYTSLNPELDSLATSLQMVYPIQGVPAFQADSTVAFNDKAYLEHVQHSVGIVKLKLSQEAHNTNVKVREFARGQEEKFAELFKLAGGKEDAHAHH